MSRVNKSKFAILGLLTVEPMSGYDIRKVIQKSIGYFWQESYSTIYPNLKGLLKDGLVSKEIRAGENGPDRHIYSITDSGRSAFLEWLSTEPDTPPLRIELLLKLFFGEFTDPQVFVKYLQKNLKAQRVKVKTLKQISKQLEKNLSNYPGYPFWQITLRYGILVNEAYMAWAQESVEKLESIEPAEGEMPMRTFLNLKD